mgnify:FL=1|tara:strand:- start:219 stop:440 length:222 start_codon:yes stop_codon:yes gene_type:complete
MYKIVIFMFLLNPVEKDILEVETLHNKPLEFSEIDKCYAHIHNNLSELKAFAASHFGADTPIKSIDCVQKNGT